MLRTTKIPVFYLDFDLMYSGCIKGKFVTKPDNVKVHRMDYSNYVDVIKMVTSEITKRKHLVILDTLNGFYRIYRKRLRRNMDENRSWFLLNKQAAYVGQLQKVALCDEEDDSPLGTIRIMIKSSDLEDLIDWFVPFV